MSEDTPDPYVPAGHLLMTSSGEYSDYRTGGCFVTLAPLYRSKLQELRDEVLLEQRQAKNRYAAWLEDPDRDKEQEPEDVGYDSAHGKFISAMIRKGWLLSITYTELYLGSYGELELGL